MNIFGQGATGPAGMPLTREMTQGGEQRTFVGQEPFIPAADPAPVQEPTTATYLSPDESRTRFAEFLPIEATPNDTLLPSDDPRVYTYQTTNGNIYYLPTYEEQLQERRGVGEVVDNLIDAVPSRTEVEDALLNAPRAAYDSIRRQVTGQGTYGDIINTAGGMVGLNTVPRSRFVDEILDETPAVGPDDYWDGVDEEAVDTDFEPIGDDPLEGLDLQWQPEPVPQPPRNPLTPEQITGPIPEQGYWLASPAPLREGKKPNSGVSPLYPPRDYSTSYAPDDTIVFRSPVREFVAGMQIPSQGIKGSQFLKMLQDNPSIRNSEVSYLNLGISPEARYTREELQQLVDSRVPQVEAFYTQQFSGYQRQPVADNELDYQEIIVESVPQNPNQVFRANSQHFNENTLAHARVSLREPEVGGNRDRYLLVEEMQSDLIQRGWQEPREPTPFADFVLDSNRLGNSVFVQEFDRLSAPEDPPIRQMLHRIISPREGVFSQIIDDMKSGNRANVHQAIFNAVKEQYPDLEEKVANNLTRFIRRQVEDYESDASNPRNTTTNPPIRNTQESTRLLVESLISYADRQGVSEIVFPPLERIAAQRSRPGTKDYEKAITPGSGFHQTYVTSLKKVIQELQGEFGRENIPVYRREIPYNNEGSLPEISFEDARDDWNDIRLQLNRIVQEHPEGNLDTHLRRLVSRLRAVQTEDENGMIVSMDDFYTSRYGEDYIHASSLQSLYERNARMSSAQLPVEGVAIDISELRNQYNLQYPRFAEGGLVTQTRQAFGGMI